LKYSKKKVLENPNSTHEIRNCSITEVGIGKTGPGEFTRLGDWSHIYTAMHRDPNEELEDSTGGPPTV